MTKHKGNEMVESRDRKERFEAKCRRVKAKVKNEIFSPSHILIVLIPLYLLLLFFGSISNLSKNWQLQQETNEKHTELAYLTLQVENLELENQYYSSEEYQELAARRFQNKKLSGEKMVYLPDNSERARRRHKAASSEERALLNEKSNLDQWLSFLFNL
jgi:cell division protein FtsB